MHADIPPPAGVSEQFILHPAPSLGVLGKDTGVSCCAALQQPMEYLAIDFIGSFPFLRLQLRFGCRIPWDSGRKIYPVQEGLGAAVTWHSYKETLHLSQESSAKEVCRPAELPLPTQGSQQGSTARGAPDSIGQQKPWNHLEPQPPLTASLF